MMDSSGGLPISCFIIIIIHCGYVCVVMHTGRIFLLFFFNQL